MPNWEAVVETALRTLNANQFCVPGAKLHATIQKLGAPDDFSGYLATEGKPFRQYLQDLDKTGTLAIDIHPRGGSDMLVGFRGAALPQYAERGPQFRLRSDVYEAFTRISPGRYRYLPREDLFTAAEREAPDAVLVPGVTLDALIEHRKRFVSEVEDPDTRQGLSDSLEFSANPLADFYRRVAELRLLPSWHRFNYELIRKSVLNWAETSGIQPRDGWFALHTARPLEPAEGPQSILSELARYMNDDEIRGLPIPFRAVEQMYWALLKKKQES